MKEKDAVYRKNLENTARWIAEQTFQAGTNRWEFEIQKKPDRRKTDNKSWLWEVNMMLREEKNRNHVYLKKKTADNFLAMKSAKFAAITVY